MWQLGGFGHVFDAEYGFCKKICVVQYVVFLLLHSCEIMEFKEMGLAVFCLLPGRKWFIPSLRRCLLQCFLPDKLHIKASHSCKSTVIVISRLISRFT